VPNFRTFCPESVRQREERPKTLAGGEFAKGPRQISRALCSSVTSTDALKSAPGADAKNRSRMHVWAAGVLSGGP